MGFNKEVTYDCRVAYLLDTVAGVLKLLEDDQDFINTIGAYITIGDIHFEFNGQQFERWSEEWELVKARRVKE